MATFDPARARDGGGMLGREPRSRGFNVQLAGGINLARDLRNGRNFEYLSEDPLLSERAQPRSVMTGGQAIAEILTGSVNPSGRLPVTFPADLAQTPRPELPGLGTPWGTPTTIRYDEGADVGYGWFAKTHEQPLYAFGHGLSYTSFDYSNLDGADVPQLYLTEAPGGERMRLLGFERVELRPGESRRVTVPPTRASWRASTQTPADGTSPKARTGSRSAKPPTISSSPRRRS